jgi:preprotein translocase SecE subunit
MSNNQNKKKPETGGLQAPKVRTLPTKEEIKEERKKLKEKRKEKIKEAGEKKPRRNPIRALRETGSELKKVNWPTLRHTLKQTGIVLGIVLIFSLIVLGIDRGLGALFTLLTRTPID